MSSWLLYAAVRQVVIGVYLCLQEDRCRAGGVPECTHLDATPTAGDMYLFGKMLLLVSSLRALVPDTSFVLGAA